MLYKRYDSYSGVGVVFFFFIIFKFFFHFFFSLMIDHETRYHLFLFIYY